jgi:hypothetical protein
VLYWEVDMAIFLLIVIGVIVLVVGGIYLGIKYKKKITDVIPIPEPTPAPKPIPPTPVVIKPIGPPPLYPSFISPPCNTKEEYLKWVETANPLWSAWFKVHPEDVPNPFDIG